MTTELVALSPDEEGRLQEYERIIERGLDTFLEVGGALLVIRDERLYKATHQRFEEYCRERWGMVRQHANRLIAAAETVRNLEPTGSIPQSERQIRPIAHLEPDQQREVWQRAVETAPGGKVTAAHVQRVVDEEEEEEDEGPSFGDNTFFCERCGEFFDFPMWHCRSCGNHFHQNQAEWCPECGLWKAPSGDEEDEEDGEQEEEEDSEEGTEPPVMGVAVSLAEPPHPSEGHDLFTMVSDDPAVIRARLLTEWAKSVSIVDRRLFNMEMEATIAAFDPDEVERAEQFARQLRNWTDRFRAALTKPAFSIVGGKDRDG